MLKCHPWPLQIPFISLPVALFLQKQLIVPLPLKT